MIQILVSMKTSSRASPERADRLADLALVAVGRSGVDVAVARLQRGLDSLDRLGGRGLEDAEAEDRHLDAVVQG